MPTASPKGSSTRYPKDHSVIQELIDAGAITAEEALGHPERHVVTRAIGALADSEADFSLVPAGPGSRLVGAWQELADRVRDLGVRPLPGATRREAAYVAAERYDAVPVVALANTADRHVFGPGVPSEQEARAYWADVDSALKRMRRATPWWRRIAARFSLASVPWRAGVERLRLRRLGRRALDSRPVAAGRRRMTRTAARFRRR